MTRLLELVQLHHDIDMDMIVPKSTPLVSCISPKKFWLVIVETVRTCVRADLDIDTGWKTFCVIIVRHWTDCGVLVQVFDR